NAMTVRVGNMAGMDHVLALLRDAGIGTPDVISPQIYIGNTGSTLKSLTAAMSIFPNNGVRHRPYIIQRVEDSGGEVIYETPVLENDVLHPAVAQLTARLLERVMKDGTAAAARSGYGFKEKAGGKTGTTNDYKDAWFAGYTDAVTCGVWVGFDQPQTILQGAYGAKLSLPVWVDVMNAAIAKGYKSTVPKASSLVAKVNLCRVSGQLATTPCAERGDAYEDELPPELVPQIYCQVHGGSGPPVPRQKRDSFFGRIFRWFK
ncbi:MAG TPA: penicillin-binding transpeptidase domain-containing protein, partial [Verrucomicrobiaceae bacterium]